MTVEEILELMDELLDKSSSVPFSQKKMIDVEQMREYIDSIRLNLPGEIKRQEIRKISLLRPTRKLRRS